MPTACAAAPARDTAKSLWVCNGPFNPRTASGVKKSTCKHRTKIRAAGRKDHAVGFHLHSFGHNHHITEEPLAGKTPEKTKIISELLVRQKATSVYPEKVSRRPTITDKAPELLPNPSGGSSSPSATSSCQCLPTTQSLDPPDAAALPVVLLFPEKKTICKPN